VVCLPEALGPAQLMLDLERLEIDFTVLAA
jgi:hypothetical protein